MPFDFKKIIGSLLSTPRKAQEPVVRNIWKSVQSGGIESALAGCERLHEPYRWTLLTAIAAHFAELGNISAFNQVWQCVVKNVVRLNDNEWLPNGTLARCAIFSPPSLVDIARSMPERAQRVFAIVARHAPDDAVAAVFAALEAASLGFCAENQMIRPLAFAGRFDLGMKCIPLIQHDVTFPRDDAEPYVLDAPFRRDDVRSRLMQGLIDNRRFKEATELLPTYETERQLANDSTDLHLAMGQPLKALEVLRNRKSAPNLLGTDALYVALAESGEIEALLDAARELEPLVAKSYGAECIREGCKFAIKAGHASAVAKVIERITPKQVRTKVEEMLALAKPVKESKSLRARATSLLEGSSMPHAITQIQKMLADAPDKERVFLLISLARAQQKGGSQDEIARTLEEAESVLRAIKTRGVRIEATKELASTLVLVGREIDGFRVLDATAGALDFDEKDDFRDLACGFVEACTTLKVERNLQKLRTADFADSGVGMFVEEALTWDAAGSDEVEKLVARAGKLGDFGQVIDMLRATRRFAEAAGVLRHAPERQKCHWDSLAGAAADHGRFQVALEIMNAANAPVPGEHPQGTPARELAKSYIFLSAYGLPGGGIENLLHVLDAAVVESGFAAP